MQRPSKTSFLSFFAATFILFAANMPAWSCEGNCASGTCDTASASLAIPRSTITADTVFSLLKSNAPVALFECRSPKQKKDVRIPGARIIYAGESPASYSAALPATDTLVILYPGLEGAKTEEIKETLNKMGFLSILEYSDGIIGWISYGYEVAGEDKIEH